MAAAPVTGPGGPARQRVRAEGACSLPTAAIALAAMKCARAVGARRQRHLPALPTAAPVTSCCFRCILAELPQAAFVGSRAPGPSRYSASPAPRLSPALVTGHLRVRPGMWTHHGKWDPKTFYFYPSKVTRELECFRCGCFPAATAFSSKERKE